MRILSKKLNATENIECLPKISATVIKNLLLIKRTKSN